MGTYIWNICELPTIKERDVKKIREFYEVLLFNVKSLRTLESLNKLNATVRFPLDKLGVIKNELAMIDEQRSEWSFTQSLEALEKWTLNNPLSEAPRSKKEKREKSRVFYSQRGNRAAKTSRGCLFCESPDHKAINCDEIVNLEERKKIFSRSVCVLTARDQSTERKTAKVNRHVKIVTLGITRHYATNRNHASLE